MPRFVILTHDFPAFHWDFMLERGAVLRTWRLLESPDSPREQPALALADHRREYLDYEGPVSGGRGTVTRWDAGEYTIIAESDARLETRLDGSRMRGPLVLARDEAGGWAFQFRPD